MIPKVELGMDAEDSDIVELRITLRYEIPEFLRQFASLVDHLKCTWRDSPQRKILPTQNYLPGTDHDRPK